MDCFPDPIYPSISLNNFSYKKPRVTYFSSVALISFIEAGQGESQCLNNILHYHFKELGMYNML